ncbi:MAG: class I SAM-dependent methyltransferase [Acidobacteriota bacterium]
MSLPRTLLRPLRRLYTTARRDREFKNARQILLGGEATRPLRLKGGLVPPDLTDREARLVEQISLVSDPADTMYRPGAAVSYLCAGVSAVRGIDASLAAAGKTISKGAILDFPCGYGRVLRFLRVMFPDATIVGSELPGAGLDFCRSAFSIQTIPSSVDLKTLTFPRKFDLMFCGSLFTHIDERMAVDLLGFFHRHLAEGGVCIFTTHGPHVIDVMNNKVLEFNLSSEGKERLVRDYQEKGYGFADYVGQSGYGISLVSQSHVAELAHRVGTWERVFLLDSGWHGLQDIHAFAAR